MPRPDCPDAFSAMRTEEFHLEENKACGTERGAQIVPRITQAGQRDASRTAFLCAPLSVWSLDGGFLLDCSAPGWQRTGRPSAAPPACRGTQRVACISLVILQRFPMSSLSGLVCHLLHSPFAYFRSPVCPLPFLSPLWPLSGSGCDIRTTPFIY